MISLENLCHDDYYDQFVALYFSDFFAASVKSGVSFEKFERQIAGHMLYCRYDTRSYSG